jgi:hypothetical protein
MIDWHWTWWDRESERISLAVVAARAGLSEWAVVVHHYHFTEKMRREVGFGACCDADGYRLEPKALKKPGPSRKVPVFTAILPGKRNEPSFKQTGYERLVITAADLVGIRSNQDFLCDGLEEPFDNYYRKNLRGE